MSGVRAAIGGAGVLVAAWGAWLLLGQQSGQELRSIVIWLAGGVVVHDAVLAPATVIVAALLARVLPHAVAAVGAVVLTVLGSLTVLAIPVLGGFGASYDPANSTIHDRPYAAGWVVAAVVVVLGSVLGVGLTRRRLRRAVVED